MNPRRATRLALPLSISVVLLAVPARAAERRIAVEASGLLPIEGESRFEIVGVTGKIFLRVGKPGELRFLSKEGGTKGPDLPIAIWEDTGAIRLSPPRDEVPVKPRVLEASVPPGMYVIVEANETDVTANSLQGRFEVRGKSVVLAAAGIEGDVEAEIEGGSVKIGGVTGSVTLRGSDFQSEVSGVERSVLLSVTGGRPAAVRQVRGGADLDLDGAILEVQGVEGFFRLRARGGTATVSEIRAGGEFRMSNASLKLEKSRGEMNVNTDAPCEFKETEASLHVDAYGPSVKISGNKGLVEVRARNAEVLLEKIEGPARVQGDGLDLRVDDVGGEVVAIAGISKVFVRNVGGKLLIENDRGDVEVTQATKEVQVKSEGGDVRLLDLTGPVIVEADGRFVEVSWVSAPSGQDSSIKNEGGDVEVRFPAGGGAQVLATAPYGRVETNIPTLRLVDGERRAEGPVNRHSRPNLRVEGAGVVRILAPPE